MMTSHVSVSCPSCGHIVDPAASYCDNCKVNLAIAAALAEQCISNTSAERRLALIAPEILVPRLGEYLMDKGLLDFAGLQKALDYQQRMSREGKPILLGQSLIELGLVERERIDQAITEQIYQLQLALEQANDQLEQRVRERTSELQAALNRLAELHQLKANFISNISHELRTPLTHIVGYVAMLLEGNLGPLEDEQRRALEVVSNASVRLEQLIDDLLQFSIAGRGELSLRIQAVDVQVLISAVIEKLMPKALAKHIEVKMISDDDLTFVLGDGEKLEWVLIQLVDNAIKFTPEHGRVEIGAEDDDMMVCIWVTDTGIGIPADRMNELFQPFHQLEGSPNRRYGGTGLGLSLAKQILDAHGSKIKVTSEVGRGSRFEFLIKKYIIG